MSTPAFGRRALLGGGAGLAAGALVTRGADAATTSPRGATPSRIDVHCHHIPDFYRQSLAQHGIVTAGGIPIPVWTPPAAVKFMNDYGIAAQVVSISEPGVTYLDTAVERKEMAERINDWTRETLVTTADPLLANRFGGFAVLPLGDPDDPVDVANACAEAVRAIRTLELDGIGVFSHYDGVYLGDPRLEPLMATLNGLGAFVFVHPVTPAAYPDLGLPTFLYEFPFDTTRAAVNMSYHQVFTRYPRVRWLLAHAGGTLPYLACRTSLLQVTTAVAQNLDLRRFDEQNLDFGRLYYDTALSPVPSAMMSVREVTSVSHIMFATDWPFSGPVFVVPGDPAPQLAESFGPAELPRVLRTNALEQLPGLRARMRTA
ncbi:amidohydrolase [Nocardioides sp. NBC_00368]|uniref:amidohydrolase family protein n=1 Tax=Nocardioides sp. NBC_00368 TaxID=2976000 RepID=UPI002E2433D3